MRREDKDSDDRLRHYINVSGIEKAPEGFSSKVMSHIYLEKKPVAAEKNYKVPVVFGAVFLILAVATLFVPENSLNLPGFKFPENFSFSFPDLGSGLIIPQTVFYILVAIVFLAVLDSGLNLFFGKQHK